MPYWKRKETKGANDDASSRERTVQSNLIMRKTVQISVAEDKNLVFNPFHFLDCGIGFSTIYHDTTEKKVTPVLEEKEIVGPTTKKTKKNQRKKKKFQRVVEKEDDVPTIERAEAEEDSANVEKDSVKSRNKKKPGKKQKQKQPIEIIDVEEEFILSLEAEDKKRLLLSLEEEQKKNLPIVDTKKQKKKKKSKQPQTKSSVEDSARNGSSCSSSSHEDMKNETLENQDRLHSTKDITAVKMKKKHHPSKANTVSEEIIINEKDLLNPSNNYFQRLQAGKIFQGQLRVSVQYTNDAYMTISGISKDILIQGMPDRSCKIHGTKVLVELYPVDRWKKFQPTSVPPISKSKIDSLVSIENENDVVDQNSRNRSHSKILKHQDNEEEDGGLWSPQFSRIKWNCENHETNNVNRAREEQMNTINAVIEMQHRQPTGKVIGTIEATGGSDQAQPVYLLGHFQKPLRPSQEELVFLTNDPRIPKLCVPKSEVQHLDYIESKYLHVVQYQESNNKNKNQDMMPMGTFVTCVGLSGDPEAEMQGLLTQHHLLEDVDAQDFGDQYIDHWFNNNNKRRDETTQEDSWSIPPEELEHRRDLRQLNIFSIDPLGARDLDDALHVTPYPNEDDTVEVGVHIADVSYFVTRDSKVNSMARSRATSMYFVDRVLPMLPRVLCEHYCSLQPKVDRLAFSVIWRLDRVSGKRALKYPVWYGRTIIRSRGQLHYREAQEWIDLPDEDSDAAPNTLFQHDLKLLHQVAMARRECRFSEVGGALSLHRTKLKFHLPSDGKIPQAIESYPTYDTNAMIEEYMLMANFLVAEKLLLTFGPGLSLTRNHAPPNAKRLAELEVLASGLGLNLNASSAGSLHASLLKFPVELKATFELLLTSPMYLAKYVHPTDMTESLCHYALNLPYYTHFTSPIRRYADVIVHRLLTEALALEAETTTRGSGANVYSVEELEDISNQCNLRNALANTCEIETDRIYLCLYLLHQPERKTREVEAQVVGIGPKSFSIYIAQYGIETRLFVSQLAIVPKNDGNQDVDSKVCLAWQDRRQCFDVVLSPAAGETKKRKTKKKKKTNKDQDSLRTIQFLSLLNFELHVKTSPLRLVYQLKL